MKGRLLIAGWGNGLRRWNSRLGQEMGTLASFPDGVCISSWRPHQWSYIITEMWVTWPGLSQGPNFLPWSNIGLHLWDVYSVYYIYLLPAPRCTALLCSVEPADLEQRRNPVYDQLNEGLRKHEIQDGCPYTCRQKWGHEKWSSRNLQLEGLYPNMLGLFCRCTVRYGHRCYRRCP